LITIVFDWVTQHTAVKKHISFCIPEHTDEKKQEMDFPALQFVHLCLQILVQLLIQPAFTYVNMVM
jgi:hypothetical protein